MQPDHNAHKWDYLIQNARIFDGSGGEAVTGDIAVSEGKIAERGQHLDPSQAKAVIDADNQWLIPGLLDIHTHYDLELELAPGLPESVRHGTTTVVIANCSLGLAFGAQRQGDDNPIIDCFARVENMPKPVLQKAADLVTWDDSKSYLEHLNQLNLGPNVVPMIPHSMLRIDAMGLKDSVRREPTDAELQQMQSQLRKGMDEGYAGFSTDALPFHYLANDPNRHHQIPTQFASYRELKALTGIVRDYERVWQATPPKDSPVDIFKTFLLTSGRLFGKPLKVTAVAAMDISSNRNILKLGRLLARLLNSKFLNGRFYLQALAAPFKIWSEGAFNPLSEEIDEMRALVETDLDDKAARQQLLNDPDFIRRFRTMWRHGKDGFGLARLKRQLRLENYAFNREFEDMTVDRCPIANWEGQTFASLYHRVTQLNDQHWDAQEREIISQYFTGIKDDADFMLAALRAFDNDLIWNTTSANRNEAMTRELIMDPILLPGFNDSGAHLTNMAFYDGNLRALKLANQGGEQDVSYIVKRLTRDAAEVFGVRAGRLEVGEQADITLINPDNLMRYDAEANVQRQYREEFEHEQLVNRSDGVVAMTMIAGKIAWQNDQFVDGFKQTQYGRVLLAEPGAEKAA